MAVIDSAYQYYLTTYGNSAVSRYDSHKKSQLRDVYNQIIKSNKESPLYKIEDTGDVQKYAIDIKERTKNVQNVVASLSDSENGIESVFSKKIAQSSDESVVTAAYIGSDDTEEGSLSGFDIQVKQLASAQINTGNYLNPERLDFEPGSYSFDLNTNSNSYEFQYTINPTDTNGSVLHKLSKLINTAGIGLSATTESNESGQSALKVASRQTGIADDEEFLFQILPSGDYSSIKAFRTLGLDNVVAEAQNSSFLLNGVEHSSYSNTFTINNAFDITLHNVNTDDTATQIGFKANVDAISDNIEELVTAYNGVIELGHLYSGTQSSNKLISDVSSVAKSYYNELEAIGLNIDSDNYIHIDRSLLADAVTAPDAAENFSVLNHFKDDLDAKAAKASINPMNYVNKVIVAYKNPGHNFATPYVTSIYSGMMLDSYC